MPCPFAKLEEVYQTQHGAVYQCSNQNCYWLDFAGDKTAFRVADFLHFKKKVDSIDVASLIIDSSRHADYTILMPFRSERCFALTLNDLLNLRELLDGARFMIELNSVIKSCLKSTPSRA
ncbi:hypothetical protein SAMN05216436_10914 [bacterium A37T11]|nr:hypothetical protein SAMN05216436_10914 [bacterium A37T11]